MKKLFCTIALSFVVFSITAQTEELIKFGDFEQWIQRDIKESSLLGGSKRTIWEIGPTAHWTENKAYTNQGGSPWATSNVYAAPMGIAKASCSVFKDSHNGGLCAKLLTYEAAVKAIGMINVKVLAAGSIFTGSLQEPVKSSNNPMSKMNMGIAFTKRPRALKFDYKVQLSDSPNRIRQTGFSKVSTVAGKDMAECVVILQKRTEDAHGNITAKRIGTMVKRFDANTKGWVENKEFEIHYGDISRESWYKDYMGLVRGERTYYAKNSKGKMVPIDENGWANADETPTHIIVKFDSSHGGAYVGSIGNTLWIDNVRFVY